MMGFRKSVFGLVGLVLLGLSSCKTTRVVTKTSTAKPISTSKLIRNIENNTFEYDYLAIKKISCQFDNGKTSTSFKASILAEKDKQITVMLTKLNIPVGRLWLTPDSVKFINYLEKSYFIDDYSYLSSWLDMDLDFNTVNAIISNNVFSLRNEKKDNQEYETRIDSGMYVLESITQLKAKKANQRTIAKKPARKPKKLITDSPIRQSIYVDPETYKLRKIKMEDAANSRHLNIDFSDFTPIEKQLYPGEISLHFVNPDSFIQLRIKFGGFSTEKENELKFKVPEKYTRINTN
jgi:outer membrane lipoprotein-sorting protein